MATAPITLSSVRDLPGVPPGGRKYRVHDDKIAGFFHRDERQRAQDLLAAVH
jgi:hypothetical protein